MNIGSVYFMVNVPLNEFFNLTIREACVHLCHTQKLPFYVFLSSLYPMCPLLILKLHVFLLLDRSHFLAIIEHIFLRSGTQQVPTHRGREHLSGHISKELNIGEEARSG
jgi:hypothetical protein